MFSRNFHLPPELVVRFLEMCSDLFRPGLETSAVRLVAHITNHEIGQMTELVGEGVDEPVFGVDYFGGELDVSVVLDFYSWASGDGIAFYW